MKYNVFLCQRVQKVWGRGLKMHNLFWVALPAITKPILVTLRKKGAIWWSVTQLSMTMELHFPTKESYFSNLLPKRAILGGIPQIGHPELL